MQDSGGPLGGVAPPPAPGLPPWEDRDRYRLVDALYLTIREVLFSPEQFFRRMPVGAGLGQPLLFALIVGVLGWFANWMWSLTGSSLPLPFDEGPCRLLCHPVWSLGMLVLSPLLVVSSLFLRAGILHLGLALAGAGQAGFEGTFRVVAYADAILILAVLPFCGVLLAVVLGGPILTIVGLRQVHRTEGWRATLAVLFPLLLCIASSSGLVMMALTRRLFD